MCNDPYDRSSICRVIFTSVNSFDLSGIGFGSSFCEDVGKKEMQV